MIILVIGAQFDMQAIKDMGLSDTIVVMDSAPKEECKMAKVMELKLAEFTGEMLELNVEEQNVLVIPQYNDRVCKAKGNLSTADWLALLHLY